MIAVEPADPRSPAATALLQASHALMQSLFPAGACHFLRIDALCGPDVHFVTARRGDVVMGCGAVMQQGDYAELKSIYVEEEFRGQGAAEAILRALEDHAIEANVPMLRLETGTGLDAAHRLYAKHGFRKCGPFGAYEDSAFSVFMEKPL